MVKKAMKKVVKKVPRADRSDTAEPAPASTTPMKARKKAAKKTSKAADVETPDASATEVPDASAETPAAAEESKASSSSTSKKNKTKAKKAPSSSLTSTSSSSSSTKAASAKSPMHGFLELKLAADAEETYKKFLLIRRDADEKNALFVTHLEDLSESQLKAVFVNFGEVENFTLKELEQRAAALRKDGVVSKTAFALVHFADASSVDRCIEKATDGFPLLVGGIRDKNEQCLRVALQYLKRTFYPDPKELQSKYDEFMRLFEKEQSRKAAERLRKETEPDEDGFVLVDSKKSFKPASTPGSGVGGANGAANAALALMGADGVATGGKKKKKPKVLENFYNFQTKERRMQEMKLEERELAGEKRRKLDLEGLS
ncbi:unnamed protein product [Amoebophrya sp. A25]|nr:unnamed protein product [Amoebophrya sp. A25]|eukprot:GSA25T00001529001.1